MLTVPPLVALTATTQVIDGVLRVRVNDAYVRALEAAGLVPIVVPPLRDPSAVMRVLDAVAGVVLSGGEDVDPTCYGAAPHQTVTTVNSARDASEIALLRAARERRMPTLAICRGVQVANVALGGTLIQDIPSLCANALAHEAGAPRDQRAHPVDVDAGSRLADSLGDARLAVNSIHHQALDRVAAPLRAVARAPDGIIEGVESTDDRWWMVGVQWHPEDLTATPEAWDRSLFAAFARECSRGA